jgi:membrane-bound lytic murein transglycosylase D
MNNPSPLLPQGSMLEQNTKNKGRARVKIAVFFVLAIHGVGLLALLMQGCKGEKENASNQTEQTNSYTAAPPEFQATNQVVTETNVPVTPTVTTTPVLPNSTENPGVATDYVVKSGDTYVTIAKGKKVSVKALTEVNPGVEPTKLQIGQKLHIPAPTAATVQTANTGAPATDANTGDPLYTVKSGDTLIRIASDHKTSVRALRTANNLRTDSIKVGQKLKIPVKMADAGTGPMASNTRSH